MSSLQTVPKEIPTLTVDKPILKHLKPALQKEVIENNFEGIADNKVVCTISDNVQTVSSSPKDKKAEECTEIASDPEKCHPIVEDRLREADHTSTDRVPSSLMASAITDEQIVFSLESFLLPASEFCEKSGFLSDTPSITHMSLSDISLPTASPAINCQLDQLLPAQSECLSYTGDFSGGSAFTAVNEKKDHLPSFKTSGMQVIFYYICIYCTTDFSKVILIQSAYRLFHICIFMQACQIDVANHYL